VPAAPVPASVEALPAASFLSVIICTYKRPALLREALASLFEQRLPRNRFEVIVVDNNSRDETAAVGEEFAARLPNLRYFHEPKQGLSHSRNRGCDEARGDYLVYLDDDARADRDYLLNVYQAIVTCDPDILGGPIFPYYTTSKPGWFKDDYEIRRHARQTGWSTRCSISGSSFVIKRGLLGELGKFDPGLGMVGNTVRLGEEKAVLRKYRLRPLAEQKVYYDLGCIVYHHVPPEKMRAGYLLKRYYVAGHAKAQIERMTRGDWSVLNRLRYAGSCCKGRLAGWIESVRQSRPRRRVKQFLIERGTGFMFEVGRFIGCFSPRRGERLTEMEGPEGT
jgi:glycosyltransferase involved in cell wall biosynthesis